MCEYISTKLNMIEKKHLVVQFYFNKQQPWKWQISNNKVTWKEEQ